MADISKLKEHIKSVSQTRQVTNAMALISSSKMRRALERYEANKAFTKHLMGQMNLLVERSDEDPHHAFDAPEDNKTAYILVSSDRGLAGSFNNDVLNMFRHHSADRDVVSTMPVGKVAQEALLEMRMPVDHSFVDIQNGLTLTDCRRICETIIQMHMHRQVSQVFIIYTKMISTVKQLTDMIQLLPIPLDRDVILEPEKASNIDAMLLFPSPAEVLEMALREYLIGMIYMGMVQSFASEQCMRMQTMDTATRNADEMLEKLAIRLNRSRQEQITQEITEISSGAMNL